MKDYFFVGCDGDLHDTRKEKWAERPLRKRYCYTYRDIKTVNQLKSTLRAGPYTWPGGYQLNFYTSDGCMVCFDCVKNELRNVMWSIKNRCDDGWRVVGCDVYYEGPNMYCEHCNEVIESEYGDPWAKEENEG